MKYVCIVIISALSLNAFASPEVSVDLDLASAIEYSHPAISPQWQYRLSRAQSGLSIRPNETLSGHFRIDAVQSAPENGYIGVQGEQYTLRVIEAYSDIGWQVGQIVARINAGLISNSWIISGNETFGYRSLSPINAEALGALYRSDVGFLAQVEYKNIFKVTVSSTNGEGMGQRERNDRNNLHAHLDFSPFGPLDVNRQQELRIELMYQNGTEGLMSTTTDRYGLRVSGGIDPISGGIEGMKVIGLLNDPNYSPTSISAWVHGRLSDSLVTLLRYDRTNHQVEQADGLEERYLFALGINERLTNLRSGWQILLGLTETRRDEMASPVAGEQLLDNTRQIWLMIGTQTRWTNFSER